MINVICVYKRGNGFTRQYVDALEKSIANNTTLPYEFICLDEGKREGWWNKIDIFGVKGKCLYIDLDTVIVGNIDSLFKLAWYCKEDEFYMLRPFNPNKFCGNWASGIMIWNGDHSYLIDEFRKIKPRAYRGDQNFISAKVRTKIKLIQEEMDGIYSFKRQCKKSLPEDASIVCFHGHPRPVNIMHQVDWMKDWREAYV